MKNVDKFIEVNIFKWKMNKKGWTIIELVVTILLIGILAGLGIPAYRNQIIKANLKSSREDILSTFRLAQTSAVSERVIYRVNFDVGNKGYQIGRDPEGDGTFVYENLRLLPQNVSFVGSDTYFEFLPDRIINMPFSDIMITNGNGDVRFFVTGGTGYKIEIEEAK